MQLDDELLLMNAYVDGEMDFQQQLRFEARLLTDPALRERVDEMRRLTSWIREEAVYHAAPAHLREALARSLPRAAVAPRRDAPPRRPVRDVLATWLAWRPFVPALALATIATLAWNLSVLPLRGGGRLHEELVDSHVRATLSDRVVDVLSSDHHTVKPWLSSRLDFSPPVRALTVPGSVLVGGRLDYLDGRRVAVLVYKQGNHIVDHYIWPSEAADRAPRISMVKGFRVAEWTQGGMAHRIVSDVSEAELAAIVKDCRATAALS